MDAPPLQGLVERAHPVRRAGRRDLANALAHDPAHMVLVGLEARGCLRADLAGPPLAPRLLPGVNAAVARPALKLGEPPTLVHLAHPRRVEGLLTGRPAVVEALSGREVGPVDGDMDGVPVGPVLRVLQMERPRRLLVRVVAGNPLPGELHAAIPGHLSPVDVALVRVERDDLVVAVGAFRALAAGLVVAVGLARTVHLPGPVLRFVEVLRVEVERIVLPARSVEIARQTLHVLRARDRHLLDSRHARPPTRPMRPTRPKGSRCPRPP